MNVTELEQIIANENKKKLLALGLGAFGVLLMIIHPVLGIPVIAGAFILFFLSQGRLKKQVGRAVALKVLSGYIQDLSFDQDSGFSDKLIDSVYMGFPGYDDIKCGDHISGSYRGRAIELCDLKLTETRVVSSGKTTRTEHVTVFQGPYISIAYDKGLQCQVTVTRRGNLLKRGSLVKLESEEFNKSFRVYCESEHDAFYIMTPHMMERVKRIHEIADHEIYLNFHNDGHVYLAVDSRHDSFELSLMDSKVEEIEKRFEDELEYLLGLIDELEEGLQ